MARRSRCRAWILDDQRPMGEGVRESPVVGPGFARVTGARVGSWSLMRHLPGLRRLVKLLSHDAAEGLQGSSAVLQRQIVPGRLQDEAVPGRRRARGGADSALWSDI